MTSRMLRGLSVLAAGAVVTLLAGCFFWLCPPEEAGPEPGPTLAKMYVGGSPPPVLVSADLDGSNVVNYGNPGGLLTVPWDIEIDPTGGKMYVTPNTFGVSLASANLDGSSPTNLAWFGYVVALALDLTSGKIYSVDSAAHLVRTCNLDGSSIGNLGNPGGLLNTPVDIELDLAAGKMYIPNLNGHNVVVANLDGSGAQVLTGLAGTLHSPYGVALDLTNEKIYIVNYGNATVTVANLDGTNPTVLAVSFLSLPRKIELDVAAGKMYIADDTTGITVANLDGSGAVNLGSLGGNLPAGATSIALGP